jgi:hypothetical protein
MSRMSPFVWAGLNLMLGIALFETKYAVQRLEDDVLRVDKQIAMDREQIHVLNAEWSYLTQPARLGDLASRHLKLQPLTAAQLGSFDTLPLKGDDPATSASDRDVPIADVLKAMQIASTPAAAAPTPKPRAVE